MPERAHKILLVEPDPDTLELLVASFSRRFDAQVTCVATAREAWDAELYEPHDLAVAELSLEEDDEGLALAEQLNLLSPRPIILLADDPGRDDVLAALRLGVRDLFPKPFAMTDLLDAARKALRGYELQRSQTAKYRRMRELLRQVIRERRGLNRRVELVCRDLVGAHRQLVHRVLEHEGSKGGSSS